MANTTRDQRKNVGQAKAVDRCWLCNSDQHLAGRCEKRCRGNECARLRLRVHAWSECPYKTKPFCQLCGETDHGVFASLCIHRCWVHDKTVHLISECWVRCLDCGARGHRADSSACLFRRDNRPKSLLDVASFKRVIPVAQPTKAVVERPSSQAVAPKDARPSRQPAKAAQREQPPRQKAQTTIAADKEAELKGALEVLEREKAKIQKELEQLHKAVPSQDKKAGLSGVQSRKGLKQSRG